jgi:hypothetical protein
MYRVAQYTVSSVLRTSTDFSLRGRNWICTHVFGHDTYHFAWRYTAQRSPPFQFAVSRGPLLFCQCIAFILGFYDVMPPHSEKNCPMPPIFIFIPWRWKEKLPPKRQYRRPSPEQRILCALSFSHTFTLTHTHTHTHTRARARAQGRTGILLIFEDKFMTT